MLVCRVLLGPTPATTSATALKAPYDGHTTDGTHTQPPKPIFAPHARGRRYSAPWTSLISRPAADDAGRPSAPTYVLQPCHAARALPVALVAYTHESKHLAQLHEASTPLAMERWCHEGIPE
jgi:hypothetical protein